MPDEQPYDPTPLATTLHAFVIELLRVPPIRQGLRDILEIYSLSGQGSEVLRTIHDQLQALAEILTISYARLILHDRLAAKNFANVSTILTMLQAQSALYADPAAETSQGMAITITRLQADSALMLENLSAEEAYVQALLARARDTAESALRAAETLRADIREENQVIRDGIVAEGPRGDGIG